MSETTNEMRRYLKAQTIALNTTRTLRQENASVSGIDVDAIKDELLKAYE